MALIDDIRQQVREIATTRAMTDDKAFGYWFLEGIEDFSQEDAEETVTGGPWDQGRDAVHDDEEASSKSIYQFKFSENLAYVRGAFTDVQRGVIAERDSLPRFDELHLVIVTIATADQDLEREKARVERAVKRWLTQNGYDVQLTLELIDLKRFLEISEKIYGVDLSLDRSQLRMDGDYSILGLVNTLDLKEHIDKDDSFLSISEGSSESGKARLVIR